LFKAIIQDKPGQQLPDSYKKPICHSPLSIRVIFSIHNLLKTTPSSLAESRLLNSFPQSDLL